MSTPPETSSATALPEIDPEVYERRWKILAVLCTSLMVVIVGNTALNVALPTLARELNASISEQQWMVDAYGLVFAGLLLTAGTIGDRFGRKGTLQFGLLVFLSGSVFAALMNSATAIVVGRAIMGFGAAFIMPATLSIVVNCFPFAERPKAIAVWSGFAGVGGALGPISSGPTSEVATTRTRELMPLVFPRRSDGKRVRDRRLRHAGRRRRAGDHRLHRDLVSRRRHRQRQREPDHRDRPRQRGHLHFRGGRQQRPRQRRPVRAQRADHAR